MSASGQADVAPATRRAPPRTMYMVPISRAGAVAQIVSRSSATLIPIAARSSGLKAKLVLIRRNPHVDRVAQTLQRGERVRCVANDRFEAGPRTRPIKLARQ